MPVRGPPIVTRTGMTGCHILLDMLCVSSSIGTAAAWLVPLPSASALSLSCQATVRQQTASQLCVADNSM